MNTLWMDFDKDVDIQGCAGTGDTETQRWLDHSAQHFSIAQEVESSPGGPKAFGHLMSALYSSGNVTSKRGEVPKNGVQRFLVKVDSANMDLKLKT